MLSVLVLISLSIPPISNLKHCWNGDRIN